MKFAGSQLWQHGVLLTVMDASNPDHIEQFKKDLDSHEKQTLNEEELVMGYPKTIINPELLDEDMLKRIQQPSKDIMPTEAVTLDEQITEDEATAKTDDTVTELMEEETHHLITKQLDYGAPGDLQENTIEDSIHTVVKRHENLAGVDMDIIEETIEKVIQTQSDFSEPPQLELTESSEQEAQMDITKHDDEVFNVPAETLDANFNDVKTVLESTFKEDMKVVGEMVEDITEELEQKNEEVDARAGADKNEQHMETLSPTQSEIKETTEVISGLSDDEKPIISGIVEEIKDVTDDTVKSMEYTAEQRNTENSIIENEKHSITDRETPVRGENYNVDEDVIEEVMRKEIYGVPTQMTTSFMEDSMANQVEPSLGRSHEYFTDDSEFQDIQRHHEITESIDKEQQDHSQDHSEEDIVEARAPEGITEAYIPKDISEDYIPEDMEEHFLERTDESYMSKGLSDNHFHDDNMGNNIKDDLRSEATISKDMTTVDHFQEYPIGKDRDQHLESFLESKVDQPGWDELSGEPDHYKSSTTYSTLFGSTLMSGNGDRDAVVYEERYDRHSMLEQSPEETYRGEIYENPNVESLDMKSAEKLPNEEIDISQVQPEFDTVKSHRHGLTGFLSSTVSDSVQNLIASTRNKFDEMLGESDGKRQTGSQFTTKTEEITGDDGRKYEVHTESYTVSNVDRRSSSDFSDTKTFSADNSDKFLTHDNDLTSGSTGIHHTVETTVTTLTSQDDKESKKDRDGLFADKKSTDELDFEFIH